MLAGATLVSEKVGSTGTVTLRLSALIIEVPACPVTSKESISFLEDRPKRSS
jgi:hypothetical protein